MAEQPELKKVPLPPARKPVAAETMPSQRTNDSADDTPRSADNAVALYDREAAGDPYAYLDPVVLERWRKYRARRSRRHASIMATLGTFLLVVGLAAYGNLMNWWSIGFLNQDINGLSDSCSRVGVVTPASEVSLRVLNATGVAGLASETAQSLRGRDFQVRSVGDSRPTDKPPGDVVISFGDRGKIAADTVAAHFDGATMVHTDSQLPTVTVILHSDAADLHDESKAKANFDALVQSGETLQALCREGR